MIEEFQFYSKINQIKMDCLKEVEERIYSILCDRNVNLFLNVKEIVQEAFEKIDKMYNNDEYINIVKKKNLLLEKNNNNIDNINNNINNIINNNNNNVNNVNNNNNNVNKVNNNNNNNEIYRRKNFIMNLNDQDKLEIIINKAKGTYGYDNHIIKRKAIADNQYSYWLLLKFKNKTTLSNREVFDSIYNITFNSIDGYESFINTKGEDFNI
jgi:hypothetical protein